MTVSFAVIGGTGVYDPEILENTRQEILSTPYGEVEVQIGTYFSREIAFLPRHGAGHSLPPHRINYRANIKALQQLGVKKIIATAAVGSLNLDMAPGEFILVDQFIDFTKNRPSTFFEGGEGVVHIDMTYPYCGELREGIKQASALLGQRLGMGGTYVCTEGPRFETPAEIRAYRLLGGDLVGMTSCPEVVLARECEMCYATVAMVTNFAAGISSQALTHIEVVETMKENSRNLRNLLMKTMEILSEERNCSCQTALKELGMF
ncbi:MAG TPA: S-methyl-5'-thioadenosine phosphorylase [Bacillota bacterium]|nr:S-methyl-5'-thioadenosine phosphorylase [Bacillota bacterium]